MCVDVDCNSEATTATKRKCNCSYMLVLGTVFKSNALLLGMDLFSNCSDLLSELLSKLFAETSCVSPFFFPDLLSEFVETLPECFLSSSGVFFRTF